MYVQMLDIYRYIHIYRKYRKKSDIFDNITIFSNPGFFSMQCIAYHDTNQLLADVKCAIYYPCIYKNNSTTHVI